MARILSVVWYKVLPARFGGQKGIAEFNQFLSAHHELVCICSRNNEPTGNEPYKILPVLPESKNQMICLSAWRKIIYAVKQHRSTHVIIEHPYYGLTGIFMKRFLGLKMIIHSHNIEYLRFKEMGRWWWPMLAWLEKTTHRYADLNLFKTNEDYSYALKHFSLQEKNCVVVPFGLNRETIPSSSEKLEARNRIMAKHGVAPGEKIILFNGTLDYGPNARAVELIIHNLIPTLQKKTRQPFKIIVCGRIIDPAYKYIENLQHEKYVYAGLVDDISDYFLSADLFINPVLEGGGIKVKVMEALSYNLNVVSTTVGTKGIDMELTGSKLTKIVDGDWETFCDQAILNWETKLNTPSEFLEKYNWKQIAREVAERMENA